MAVGFNSHKDSYGQAVPVTLTSSIEGGNQLVYAENWLGFAVESGDSGDEVALNVECAIWQIEVPSSFDPAKGAIVYADTTEVTGHKLNDAAFTTTSSGDTVKLGRVVETKDSNDILLVLVDLV